MKSWEHRLTDTHAPEVEISSHRARLRAKLASAPPRRSVMRSPLIVGMLVVVVALAGITAIHPTWASELFKILLVSERTATAPDGAKVIQRTYQVQTDAENSGMTMIRLEDRDGQTTAEKVNASSDALPKSMQNEAEQQVQSGRAQVYMQNAGSVTYKITLSDGRKILYTKGPGDNWSISEEK
jgi:hypothetical protein